MTTQIEHPQWSVKPDSELDIEAAHIESLEFDNKNKNWFITSTYFAGITYGYRIIQITNDHFKIVDAWRSDDTKDNQNITHIPQSDINWFTENLQKFIAEIQETPQ